MGLLTAGLALWAMLAPNRVVVFSSQRFGENLGKVYALGTAHLFSVRSDGSDLRQLTHGDGFDVEPCLSKDRRHLLFWRGNRDASRWDDSPFELYTCELDGNGERSLGRKIKRYPIDGLARAYEAFPKTKMSFEVKDGTSGIRRGSLNPSGTRFLTVEDIFHDVPTSYPVTVIDVATGKSKTFSVGQYGQVWLGDDRVVALDKGMKSIVVTDASGHQLLRVVLTSKDRDALVEDIGGGFSYPVAFSLWNPKVLLYQTHFSMSDGGYENVTRVDLANGMLEALGCGKVYGVASDGVLFLAGQSEWVGEYKGDGAERLCKLVVWNAKTLHATRVGPRLCLCFGACFLP